MMFSNLISGDKNQHDQYRIFLCVCHCEKMNKNNEVIIKIHIYQKT